MKKSKATIRGKVSKKARAAGTGSRKAVDLGALRQRITGMVGAKACGMVQKTMAEVDKGHYAAMKFLFEMIGLYPATPQEQAPQEDSLARTLLRRMGFPEEPTLAPEVTKDCQPERVAVESDAVE
jgi:hypothetical protein